MIWLIPAFLFAVFDLYALRREQARLRQLTRPLMSTVLFVWFYFAVMPVSQGTQIEGLDLSNIFWGLIFLLAVEMLEASSSPRIENIWAARLLALIFFSLAFGGPIFPGRYLLPGLILAAMVLGLGIWVFTLLAPRLAGTQKLVAAAYALLVSMLLLSAAATLVTGWGMVPSYTVIAGALLWYLAALYDGWTRFVEPQPEGDLRLRVMFLAGQLLLAAGTGMQALGLLDFTI